MVSTYTVAQSVPFATMARIATQLKNGLHTIALVLLIPPLLLTLLYYVFYDLPTPPE